MKFQPWCEITGLKFKYNLSDCAQCSIRPGLSRRRWQKWQGQKCQGQWCNLATPMYFTWSCCLSLGPSSLANPPWPWHPTSAHPHLGNWTMAGIKQDSHKLKQTDNDNEYPSMTMTKAIELHQGKRLMAVSIQPFFDTIVLTTSADTSLFLRFEATRLANSWNIQFALAILWANWKVSRFEQLSVGTCHTAGRRGAGCCPRCCDPARVN